MNYPRVNDNVGKRLFNQRQPFVIRLEYRGTNWDNMSGRSSKFWQITYDGSLSGVQVSWGRIGSRGQSQEKALFDALEKLYEKLDKGYAYTSDTQTSLSPPPGIKLTGPYAEIRSIVQVGADRFKAFDKEDVFLMELNKQGAEQVLLADGYRITMKRMAAA